MASAYEILGVAPESSDDEIKRAFHRKARELHPDTNIGASEEDLRKLSLAFARVVEAWESLRDPARRAAYDRSVRDGFGDMGGANSEGHRAPQSAREYVIDAVVTCGITLVRDISEGSDGGDATYLVIGLSLQHLESKGGIPPAQGSNGQLHLALDALLAATEKINEDFLLADGGLGAFIPDCRKIYVLAANSATHVREQIADPAVLDPEAAGGRVISIEERLDEVNRRRRRLDDPPLARRPFPVCEICGSGPATKFGFEENRGMILMRQRRRLDGHFCRSCALTGGRDMQAKNLTFGWWGKIISAASQATQCPSAPDSYIYATFGVYCVDLGQ